MSKNKSSLNTVYCSVRISYRIPVVMRIYWLNHHNANKHNKPTSISAKGFDPASVEPFRICSSDGADAGFGNWLLCYWTVIQKFYQGKFVNFVFYWIRCNLWATNFNPCLRCRMNYAGDITLTCRWRCLTIMQTVGTNYRSLQCALQKYSILNCAALAI